MNNHMKKVKVWLWLFFATAVLLILLFNQMVVKLPSPKYPVKLIDLSARFDGGTMNAVYMDENNDTFEIGFLIEYVEGIKVKTLYYNNNPNNIFANHVNIFPCSINEESVSKLLLNIAENADRTSLVEVKTSYSLLKSIKMSSGENTNKACGEFRSKSLDKVVQILKERASGLPPLP